MFSLLGCVAPTVLLSGCDGPTPLSQWLDSDAQIRSALREELGSVGPEVARFYAARDDKPLWLHGNAVRPEVDRLIAMVDAVPTDVTRGVDGRALHRLKAEAASGDPERLARLELAASSALTGFGQTLHAPVSRATTIYVGSRPRGWVDGAQLLTAAAEAPSLDGWLISMRQVNPLQRAYLNGLAAYRAQWAHLPLERIDPGSALAPGDAGPRVRQLARRLGREGKEARFNSHLESAVRAFQRAHGLPSTGIADAATVTALNRGPAHYEQIIRANLDRAGALPLDLGPRYVLVNSAAQELYVVENGRVRDRMRVIIGKAATPTPDMVAPLRFLVVNPYWNVPPDLAAKRAARVVREGPEVIGKERLQLLSGWEGEVRELKPDEVDWPAVASGRMELRMRQRPGGDNMMGRVKFMAPNRLGIYLHDTPIKSAFALPDRRLSAGCVRVEDAERLARWLTGRSSPLSVDGVNVQLNLPQPVPLYIGHFTAVPDGGSITFVGDTYRRDPALLARLDRGRSFVAAAARPPK